MKSLRLIPLLVLACLPAACSRPASSLESTAVRTPAPPVALAGLRLDQHESADNILRSTFWHAWTCPDGNAWVQRTVKSRDMKPREGDDAWEARGGKWQFQVTRWKVVLPAGWWADAERLAGEHRFLELSQDLPKASGPGHEGEPVPAILAIPKTGDCRTVRKWEGTPMPDFDPLYDLLKGVRKQAESAEPEYEGDAGSDWQPPAFPTCNGTVR